MYFIYFSCAGRKRLIQKTLKKGNLFSNSIVIHYIDFFRSHDDGCQLKIKVLDNPKLKKPSSIVHYPIVTVNTQTFLRE